jgi:hypothetical protein
MNAENYAYFLASDWSTRRKPFLQPQPTTPKRAPVVSLYGTAVAQWIPSSLPTRALSELPLPSPFRLFDACVCVCVVCVCVCVRLSHAQQSSVEIWITYISSVIWSVAEEGRFLLMQYKCCNSDHQQLQRPKRYGITTTFFHSLSDFICKTKIKIKNATIIHKCD